MKLMNLTKPQTAQRVPARVSQCEYECESECECECECNNECFWQTWTWTVVFFFDVFGEYVQWQPKYEMRVVEAPLALTPPSVVAATG